MNSNQDTFYRKYGKRIIDVVLSGMSIIILSPVLLILTILVRVKHGSPVLFSPTRPGKDEKIFHIYKFRTMSNAHDKNGVLLPDADRLTKFGKIMRATSLDELPELFNIFLGDMSFVGPRPLGKNTLPAYSEQHRKRFQVRPGLTGLAQIRGRNDLAWDTRFQYDIDYISNLSFFNDAKIFIETIFKVIKREDVTVPGTTELLSYNTTRKLDVEGKIQPIGNDGKRLEIGGDFWLSSEHQISTSKPDSLDWLPNVEDSTLTFAGRAALELALIDIQSGRRIRNAYVPSYCSFGMLQPFVERDIPYTFYDVLWENDRLVYKMDPAQSCDVVLIMNYYGCCDEQTDYWIDIFKKRGCIIVEDITHTLLDKRWEKSVPDYYVASLRKWFAIPTGGWLGKTKGQLTVKPSESGDAKVEHMVQGMIQKSRYIAGQINDKKSFIVDISGFEEWLVLLDCHTMIDKTSEQILRQEDIKTIKERQKKNARRLYERLYGIKELQFINSIMDLENSCPLYVPVLLPHDIRNSLKAKFEEEGIYCPITWEERMGAISGIRDRELSLVCDYRYSEQEMDKLADMISSFLAKSGC